MLTSETAVEEKNCRTFTRVGRRPIYPCPEAQVARLIHNFAHSGGRLFDLPLLRCRSLPNEFGLKEPPRLGIVLGLFLKRRRRRERFPNGRSDHGSFRQRGQRLQPPEGEAEDAGTQQPQHGDTDQTKDENSICIR